MLDSSEDHRIMLTALRAAIAAPGNTDRPGHLRHQLVAALGPEEAARQRRLVHQVLAAAEENLPPDLRRISPLTPRSLHRLSDDLATARGWTPEAAQRVTQLWASALGFTDLAASSWPRDLEPGRGGSVDVTAAPPGAATLLPPRPASLATPGLDPGPDPHWPAPPKALARHSVMISGEPAVGATLAYAGMSLPLCVAATVTLTVVLCLPILILGATGVLLPLLAVAGGKLLVSRLGRGAVVASPTGVEFVPYDASLRTPRPERAFGAPWSQVQVEPGRVSVLRIAGRRVQVGPRNRGFAVAAAHRVGRQP